MGYRIEGDGSYRNTFVWKDGEQVKINDYCIFRINEEGCVADVDGIEDRIDRMLISGIYLIVSDGEFHNSRIIFADEMMRGVRSLVGRIVKDQHPMIVIEAVMLPNIVEVPETNEENPKKE